MRGIGLLAAIAAVLAGVPLPPPVISDDDKAVIEVVLRDMIDYDDVGPAVAERKMSSIVLVNKTYGSPDGLIFLSDAQLDGEGHEKGEKAISADLRAELARRNPKEPISLAGFTPASSKILVKGEKAVGDFRQVFPDAKVYVVAWLPGYSKDGQSAVFRACFGPTAHGATVTYMLLKKAGRWRVAWRATAYYV